jgi:hypothetical protein
LDEWLTKRKIKSGGMPAPKEEGKVMAATKAPWADSSAKSSQPSKAESVMSVDIPPTNDQPQEFKIKRDISPNEHPEQTIRIDKDGNISYL